MVKLGFSITVTNTSPQTHYEVWQEASIYINIKELLKIIYQPVKIIYMMD